MPAFFGHSLKGVVSDAMMTSRMRNNKMLKTKANYLRARNCEMKGIRQGVMRGGDGEYIDYSRNPDMSPDPMLAKEHIILKQIEVPQNETYLISISLSDGGVEKLYAEPDWDGVDVFNAFVDRLELFQFDLFGLYIIKDNVQHNFPMNTKLKKIKKLTWETDNGPKSHHEKIVFKIKWWKTPFRLDDINARKLYLKDLQENIVNGKFQPSDKVATRLAAIQFQLRYGDFIRSKHRPGYLLKMDLLHEFICNDVIENYMSTEYVETRIFSFHRRLGGFDKDSLESLYISIAKESQSWGFTYFPGTVEDDQCIVGVAEDGILINMNPVLDDDANFIPYYDIINIEAVGRGINFTFRKYRGQDKKRGKKSELFINLGKKGRDDVMELACGYIETLLYQQTEGVIIDPPMVPDFIPDGRFYMRPMYRVREKDDQKSALYWLKRFYLRECRYSDSEPLGRFLLQIENRLDNEELLDIIDLRFSKINDEDFELIWNSYLMTIQKKVICKLRGSVLELIPDIHLHTLILNGNSISDGDLVGRLINLATVVKVDISDNHLGIDGAKNLAPHLKDNFRLEELLLAHNSIQTDGFKTICKSVVNKENFRVFDFSANELDNECLKYINRFMETISCEALDLSENNFGDEALKEILKGLQSNKRLKYINISNCSATRNLERPLDKFFSNTNLHGLKLANNKLSFRIGPYLKHLMKQENLVVLDISYANIGSAGTGQIFRYLHKCQNLSELIVSGNITNKKGLKLLSDQLKKIKTIERLGLSYCKITKDGFITLSRGLSINESLTSLDISANNLSSKTACRHMEDVFGEGKLRELNLSGCCLEDKQLELVSEGIANSETLTRLHLDQNKFTQVGIKQLCYAIKLQPNLNLLTLQETGLETGLLVEILKRIGKSKINILDVRRNPKIMPRDEQLLEVMKRYINIYVKLSNVRSI
eukprot:TRINITY_DN1423_c0_g2_i1.p1 TRINITY_DN1423_c0_g2~~TRINITY_DN1423_c0_g2_i1.p1  ORF type:complete len:1050 (+),score=227.93 TRINITY_DN1423_c0_g2_i1:331-3150(+)